MADYLAIGIFSLETALSEAAKRDLLEHLPLKLVVAADTFGNAVSYAARFGPSYIEVVSLSEWQAGKWIIYAGETPLLSSESQLSPPPGFD